MNYTPKYRKLVSEITKFRLNPHSIIRLKIDFGKKNIKDALEFGVQYSDNRDSELGNVYGIARLSCQIKF